MLFTVEAENVKTILATKFKDYELSVRRKSAFQLLIGSGIFASDGMDWKHSRELIRPSFSREQVADLKNFEEHLNCMLDAIPKDGMTTVDLQELFFKLTIDTATEFLFGESTNVLLGGDSPNAKANLEFAEAWHRSQLEVLKHVRSPFYYRAPRQFNNDVKTVNGYVGKYVQQGLQYRNRFIQDHEKGNSKDGRYVFIHELVKALEDPVRIRDEMLSVLLASRDTTASLLSNMWFTLARRPDIWAKLRKEVDETLRGERPTFEQLKEMKYLKAVMNECMQNSLHWMNLFDQLNRSSFTPRRRRPLQQPRGHNRHRASRWRWPRWQIPGSGPPRPNRKLLDMGHASPSRLLRLRRRRVQAGALGAHTAYVGIFTVQRRAESVPWAAVCAYGGRVHYGPVDAAVFQGGKSG